MYTCITTHHLLSSAVLLSCRVAVFLPCLPVLLFCRFCRTVLRAAIRTATRLITCVVATGTLPIRTVWWIFRGVTCTQVEYDYYADGAPVVSCAVRAAMSGRRQTRPPAILGEVDNCECNACVWRRAHEAKLPPGKQTEPIRRRPTPVGPRRLRRFLRFCSCIPNSTLYQRIRIRLDGLRLRVASTYVEFTLNHQHLICNSTLVTATVGSGLLVLWVLGYTLPRPIPAAVFVAATLSLWSFKTLLLALRPGHQVLATIEMEQLANALPQIKEERGVALKQQFDDCITKVQNHHQLSDGSDPEYYISAPPHRAGLKSAIWHAPTTAADEAVRKPADPYPIPEGGCADGGACRSGGRATRDGKIYCHDYKINTHSTNECDNRARRLAADAVTQAGSKPFLLTNTPVADAAHGASANACDSAWKSGSHLHNQTSTMLEERCTTTLASFAKACQNYHPPFAEIPVLLWTPYSMPQHPHH
jgi:hypothetical protein